MLTSSINDFLLWISYVFSLPPILLNLVSADERVVSDVGVVVSVAGPPPSLLQLLGQLTEPLAVVHDRYHVTREPRNLEIKC